MKKINDWVADHLAIAMSSMWLFWLLLLTCLVAYGIQPPTNAQGQILFWVSILFQGVALPVLAFVSNQQGDRTERVLRETHDAALAEFQTLKEMHQSQADELAELRELHKTLAAKHGRLLDTLEHAAGRRKHQ